MSTTITIAAAEEINVLETSEAPVTTISISEYLGTNIGINQYTGTDVSVQENGGTQISIIENAGTTIVISFGSLDIVFAEVPAGLVNGSNATFTTEFEFIPETVVVSVNGLEQLRVVHFNTTGSTTILLNDSPLAGEVITVTYKKL